MVVAISEHVHLKQITRQEIVKDVELIAIKWVGNPRSLELIHSIMEIPIVARHTVK